MTVRLYEPPSEDAPPEPDWMPFDLFACWHNSLSAQAISWLTSWPFGPRRLRFAPCHVAFALPSGTHAVWAESTMACSEPCLYRGVQKYGAQLHPIRERLADYVQAGGRVDVYRLSPFWQLSPAQVVELRQFTIEQFLERDLDYDIHGAFFAGCRVLKLIDLALASGVFPAADLDQMFCSEMVAALAMKFGLLPISNSSRYTPGGVLRAMVGSGVIKYHRTFSTPADVLVSAI